MIIDDRINIDLNDVDKMLAVTILPRHWFNYKIVVGIVCIEDNDYKWETKIEEGVLFCTLPLDYNQVRGMAYEDVTVLVKDELRKYAYQLVEI